MLAGQLFCSHEQHPLPHNHNTYRSTMTAVTPEQDLASLSINGDAKASAANGATTTTNGTTSNGDAEAGDSDDDEDDNDAPGDGTSPAEGAAKKKKKRKPRKKKKAGGGGASAVNGGGAKAQSSPPRIPVSQLFPNDSYPVGEEVEYKGENGYRTTSEEKRHLDRMNSDFLREYRQAAEVHREVRKYAKAHIAPGQSLTEIAEMIEDGVRHLTGHQGLEEGDNILGGVAFPTGVNLDHIAAHYTPNAGNKTILKKENVMKVDIGVHINGRIVDSAFTVAFEPQYDNLLAAVRDATNTGVRAAGIDARLGEIGEQIQETMESYECEINRTTYPIKAIRNLNGHTIVQHSIHGGPSGKSVPIVKGTSMSEKMEEGEIYAIETFGSTGRGYVHDDLETSHYARMPDAPKVALRVASAKKLLQSIDKNFGTLPFCRRYLDRLGHEKYLLGLNSLVKEGVVQDYPPLVDVKGSYTAQFEHTILLRPNVKEVISRGDDY